MLRASAEPVLCNADIRLFTCSVIIWKELWLETGNRRRKKYIHGYGRKWWTAQARADEKDSLCHGANFSCFSTDICRNVSLLRLKHTIHTYQLDIIFCRPQILVSFDWSRQNTGTSKVKRTQVLRRGHLPIHGTSISHGFGSRRFPIAYLIVDLPNESSKISCACERTQHGQSLI